MPLANPAAIPQYNGLQDTNDPSDARWLAHVVRLGVFPAGAISPQAERAGRDLLRQRAHWVRQHTAQVLSVPTLMARHPGARFRAKRLVDRTPADRQGRLPEAAPVRAVTRRLAVVHGLGQPSKTREKTVNTGLQPPPA